MHTTNYFNTLIEPAEDCPVSQGEVPPLKRDKKSVANHQFDLIIENPYTYTSDEILFSIFAIRKEISSHEMDEQRALFFSKGQPCLRASPLPKRYGWGIHSDEQGKVAMYAVDSEEYQKLLQDDSVEKTKAMRSKRA